MNDVPTPNSPAMADELCRQLESLWGRGRRPDPDALLAAAGVAAPASVAAVLAVDQWRRWHAGERPAAEDYLARHTAVAADPACALQVVYGEFLVREELGEAPAAQEYLARFPLYAEALRVQFGFHAAMETTGGSGAGTSPAPPADLTRLLPPEQTAPPAAPADLAFLRPAEAADELGRLGGYRVLRRLGAGGMGLVFVAEDPTLRRRVALKVMRPALAASADGCRRFLREARAAAAVQHEQVIPIHQVGEDNGVPFIAMPLLAGESLEDRLCRDGCLPLVEALRVGREAAEGLAAAHEAGVLHRDVKPANIWLEAHSSPLAAGGRRVGGEGFRVKLLDFGLARFAEGGQTVTHTGMVLGTPAYMSPEQADGKPLDARSDLFSLGCVLYRTTTGQQPFARDGVTATLRAVVDHTPAAPHEVAPGVPPPLSALIVRLLAKSPADRPESAAAVAVALRQIESGDVATESYAARPARPPVRRRGAAVVAAVLVGAAALVGLVLWAFHRPGPGATPPPSPATMPYEGYADVIVWTKAGGAPRRMRLSDEGALPLRPGDQFRIEAKVTPKAYLYLFWIDTEGQATPIYPWAPGQWGTRPAAESPRDQLALPASETKGYKIAGDREGMETLLLLARPSKLDADDAAVKGWFEGLQPQRPVQNALSAVWFENGQVVRNDSRRKRQAFEEGDIDDPVLRMQGLLRERLQPHAAFTTAVSFAKQGK
jgi:tRNA A-37 threonylcarbamoyl transferase component Bud32